MSKKAKKAKGAKKGNHSTIPQHKRAGKVLTPPLAQIAQMQLQSWRDERLPEMLWAALLTNIERKTYLELFRAVALNCKAFDGKFEGLEHSNLSKLSQADFDQLLKPVLESEEAMAALRPLGALEHLPDADLWSKHLQKSLPEEDFRTLSEAVSRNTFHQSEAATDCRWLRLFSMIAGGRVHYGPDLSERVREIAEFPNRGDLRSVRPSIRAGESAFGMLDEGKPPNPWPEQFWEQCWHRTTCIILPRKVEAAPDDKAIIEQLVSTYRDVVQHFYDTAQNTGLDARRDAVFGLVLYGMNLCLTLNGSAAQSRAEGRLVIRTLAEVVITLAFLLGRDSAEIWSKYRKYGSGQAKLAYLKLVDLESDDIPSFVDVEELEMFANEDVWQEYQEIDLGHWAGLDLRRMSEEAKVKAVYDKYYGWPSGFTHAHWVAVRDTTFDQCLNPLHRFHRVPSIPRIDMGSVAVDSVRLVNMLLSDLNKAYPTFKGRIKAEEPPKPRKSAKK